MKRLSGGIDVGSVSHHITILDEEGKVFYHQKVAHILLKRLNHIEYMPGLTDIYQTLILSYAQHISELQKEIKDIDRKLDEIGEKNKEVNHLKTIPGVATRR